MKRPNINEVKMPFDSMTLTAVKNELSKTLIDARLEKIYMPASNLLVLNFHGKSGKQKLLIALDNYARVHLTDQSFENPLNAPSFCMHLRKYLNGAKLANIYQPKYERILELEFLVLNELRDLVSFKVIAEIMGKYSNVLAVNEKGIITDCVKHIHPDITSSDTSVKRTLLPNLTYTYPQTEGKITIDDKEEFLNRLADFSGGSLEKYIMGFLKGIAPSTARELLADIRQEQLDHNLCQTIYNRFYDYAIKVSGGVIEPVVVYESGEPIEYYLFPPALNTQEIKRFNRINKAIDTCMSQKTNISAFKVKYNEFYHILKGLLSKAEKKRILLESKLRESQKADEFKLYGELLINNLHNIKSREDKVKLYNYYDNCEITVPLDLKLTPQANAQKYFKKYNKLKKTAEMTVQQIDEQNDFINYIESVQESLRQCQNIEDLVDIEIEMKQSGILKDNSKKKKEKTSKPREYNIDGYIIRVGKNNIQNDLLVRASKPEDIWLHTKDIHSSHAVIITDKNTVPDSVLINAAEITAFYSKAYMSQNVPIDYTLIKHVKKPPKSAAGKVVYSEHRTLYVNPNQREEYKLDKS